MTGLSMLLGLALAAAPPGAAAPAGRCTLPPLKVEVDAESLTAAGWKVDPMRIDALKIGTMASLGRAFYSLCSRGKVAPSLLAGKTLTLQNGEGATEPHFLRPEGGVDRLILQYAFQDGPPPEAVTIEPALLCFVSPKDEGCATGD